MSRVAYAVHTAAANTTTGVQTITASLSGQTPKGVIIMASRGTAAGTITAGAMLSVGVCDGTNQRVVAAMAENGVAFGSADSGRHFANDKLVILTNTTDETIDGEAEFSSFSADSVAINWTNAPSFAAILVVIFIYGEDAQCGVGNYAGSTSNGTEITATSTLGFKPRWIFGIHQVAVFNSGGAGTGASARGGFGFASVDDDGTIRQGCVGWMDRDVGGSIETVSAMIVRSDYWASNAQANAAGTVSEQTAHEVTSFDASGFKVTTRVAGGVALNVAYLAVYTGNLRAWVGAPALTTSSTGIKSLGSQGWRSQALFAIATSHTALGTISGSSSIPTHLGIGFARASEEFSIGYQVEDAAATSDTRSVTTVKLVNLPNDSGGTLWSALLSSFGATEASINVDNASASDNYSVFLALEGGHDPGYLPMPNRRWRRQLARM